MNERVHTPLPGVPMLLALLVLSLANVAGFPTLDGMNAPGGLIALNGLGALVLILLWCGFFMVQPNNGVRVAPPADAVPLPMPVVPESDPVLFEDVTA